MTKAPGLAVLALASLGLALVSLTPSPASSAPAGYEASAASRHKAQRRAGKRPRIRPDSARHPGGRCGQLNLERARLYGLCR